MLPHRRAILAALAFLLTPAAPAFGAGDPIMPLSQVQRGMQCTGYTVIRGTEVTTFDVLIEDVVYDAVNAANILMTISGPAVDDGGAGPGFSGSPIYCPSPEDGSMRVAGALSFGIGDYDNKMVLATPIEAMLGEPVTPPSGARRATAREAHPRPLGVALGISGLSPRIGSAFVKAAARAGVELHAVPAAARATNFPVQPLRPGSAFSVGYSSGDVALGGTGTITYVDGASVWGFGHPFDSVGRRSLFLQDAYVYGIVKSPSTGTGAGTYKLAAPGHDIGTLTGDGAFSVTGVTGALPPHFPMIVTANDLDSGAKTTTSVHIADERDIGTPIGISPLGLVGTSAIAQSAYAILHGSPLNTSGDMCVSIKIAERKKGLGFCNTYVAAGTGLAPDGAASLLGTAPVADFGSVAAALDSYRVGPLHVEDVSVTLNLRRGLAQAFMTRMTGPAKLTRGKTYTVRLFFRRAGGERGSISFPVRIPALIKRGKRDLVLSGTPSDFAGGGFSGLIADIFGGESPSEAGPPSLAALARQIGAIHRYDGITASVRRRHRKGQELAPPSTPDSLPGGADGRALRERHVYRDPDLRYSGAVSIPVVVR